MAADRRHVVIGFDRPEQIRGGFDRLAALAEAGDLKIVDVEFIHSIRGVPSTVRAGQIDPDLAGYDGANAGLLSQSDLDIVADAIPVGSMAAVILYDGTSIGAALTAWSGDGATVIREGLGASLAG
ncbi:MAG: hypothetical protein KDB71_09940 [Mycobacterium sp.]|nr:hypothetical protein [Mycobacterium sp.]